MERKIWLEVALNGGWTRKEQPKIPIEVDELIEEGIACAEAGAAIIHVHAYDKGTGRQNDDVDAYATVIRGIREKADVLVYPGTPVTPHPGWRSRFDAVEILAERGLMEWCIIDPGSVNLCRFEAVAADRPGYSYVNPEAQVREGLELSVKHGFHPTYSCYEPGFVRLGAALRRAYRQGPRPIYRFMFSDEIAFGFPPTRWALDTYLRLLAREAGPEQPWMVAGLGVDVLSLIPAAAELGGHVRVGLEDAPLGSSKSNLEWVQAAVEEIGLSGGSLATAAEIREALKAEPNRADHG